MKMSLNWQWDDVMGECTYRDGTKSVIYEGNAQMIAINHLPNDMYSLSWFSCDKNHLRNMLGLNKGYDGCVDDGTFFNIETIRLNTKYKGVPQIVGDFAKAKIKIRIELYNE